MSLYSSDCVIVDPKQFLLRVCGCGAVHLNFAATVVNVAPHLIGPMADTFKQAVLELNRLSEPAEAPQNIIQGRFPLSVVE